MIPWVLAFAITIKQQALLMRNTKMNVLNALLVTVLGTTLVACGSSDLEQLHEQQLDDAINDFAPSAALPVAPAQNGMDLTKYELVFNDEFEASFLDVLKWDTALWSSDTIIYEQKQFYVDTQDTEVEFDSPFALDGNSLTISASQTPVDKLAEANNQPYLSGLITSRNTFDFEYGYVEARVRVSEGAGIWPSVWMLGADGQGLKPEIYIMEYDGDKPDSLFNNYNYVDDEGNLRSPGQQQVDEPGFSDGYQIVGLQWSPGELLFRTNGRATYRIIGDNVPSEDMYLILNLAMGGIWPSPTNDDTPDPATFDIDYVRVYQLLAP